MLRASPSPGVTSKHISTHCHMSPQGARSAPAGSHWSHPLIMNPVKYKTNRTSQGQGKACCYRPQQGKSRQPHTGDRMQDASQGHCTPVCCVTPWQCNVLERQLHGDRVGVWLGRQEDWKLSARGQASLARWICSEIRLWRWPSTLADFLQSLNLHFKWVRFLVFKILLTSFSLLSEENRRLTIEGEGQNWDILHDELSLLTRGQIPCVAVSPKDG